MKKYNPPPKQCPQMSDVHLQCIDEQRFQKGIFWKCSKRLSIYFKWHVCKTVSVRHSTAIRYPSIENLFNGCQGHPLVCLPPGTAQWQPDQIKKGSNTQQFIQLTVVGDINAKRGWSLKTEKNRLLWHVHDDTTHTSRHLFLTWTSLYLSTFLKT